MIHGLNQDVTHWVGSRDGFGAFSFGTPVALKGRWQEKAEQFRSPAGDDQTSKSVVYLEADVDIGDYLFLGTSIAADPATLSGALAVQQFMNTPDLRNLRNLRKVFL